MEWTKGRLLYEGKAKIIYETQDPNAVWVHYKDDATAFDGKKRASIESKGSFNNRISALLFEEVEQGGVPTHFLRLLSDRDMLVRPLEMLKVEVVVRNTAAGSLSKRIGLPEGQDLPRPILEFYYKNDDLGDPLINNEHIAILGLADPGQLERMSELARQVNEILQARFLKAGLILVDFKLEFGVDNDGRILLGDEISPDTCRLWDVETREKLDKDRFRRDLGGVQEAYAEVLRRLEGSR